jgi:hypothetical protein
MNDLGLLLAYLLFALLPTPSSVIQGANITVRPTGQDVNKMVMN